MFVGGWCQLIIYWIITSPPPPRVTTRRITQCKFFYTGSKRVIKSQAKKKIKKMAHTSGNNTVQKRKAQSSENSQSQYLCYTCLQLTDAADLMSITVPQFPPLMSVTVFQFPPLMSVTVLWLIPLMNTTVL